MPQETQGRVDINNASAEELVMIEGIDGERARLILEYRSQHGPFRSWQDFEQVPGIGGVLTEKAKEAATLGAEESEQARAGESVSSAERGAEEAAAGPTVQEEVLVEAEEGNLGEALEEQVQALQALAFLDAEAAAAYDIAADLIEVDEVSEQLVEFRDDHLRHIDDINDLIERYGGAPADNDVDRESSVFVALTEAIGGVGTKPGIAALIGNEQMTNSVYATALELTLEDDSRAVLERNYADERRHLATLQEMSKRDFGDG